MKIFLILSFCLAGACFSKGAFSQVKYFNPVVVQQLVDQNKKTFSENTEGFDNQVASTAGVTKLKQMEDKCKQVFDYLDDKLNQGFIALADALTAKQIIQTMADIYSYQKIIGAYLVKKPWLAVFYYKDEAQIITEAESLISLITLCVLTYGQINKMSVEERKIVYTQIQSELSRLKFNSMSMAAMFSMASFGDDLKKASIYQPVFQDKILVGQVIKDWKN